jgi:hypothetical protein
MTKEEALCVNAALIKKGKGYHNNATEWKYKRCALCCDQIKDGDEYITFIPLDYKHYVRSESKILHALCLDFKDRSTFSYSFKTAHDTQPLLTDNWIYDIIQRNGE